MEGFSYTNIFETKGIEYLIIISFLLVITPFWLFVSKENKVSKKIQNALNVLTASIIKIPQGLFFSKNHTWLHLEKTGLAKIGLNDFLLKIIGDVQVNEMKTPGELVQKGDLIAEINQNGKRLKVFSPISGEIVDSNFFLIEKPGLLNDDPYGKGWFYKVKPTNWAADTSTCYLAEDATSWITKELNRFKDFLSISVGKYSLEPALVTLQEGGELQINPLAEMQLEIWDDFQKEFLD